MFAHWICVDHNLLCFFLDSCSYGLLVWHNLTFAYGTTPLEILIIRCYPHVAVVLPLYFPCSRPILVVRENIHGTPTFSICQFLDAQFLVGSNPTFGLCLVPWQSVGLVLGQNWGCVCWANWWLDCIFLSKSIIFHLDSINIHLYSIYIPFIFHVYSFYIPFNSIYIPLISSLNFICIFLYTPFMFKFIFHLYPVYVQIYISFTPVYND